MNPTQSDLHVNVPLTNVSVAYKQDREDFISDKVFANCPVKKQSDYYWRHSKSDGRRTDVAERAPSTESKGTGWNVTTDQYFAKVYAVHTDIDDQLRGNADSYWQLDRDATELVTEQLLLKRELDWAATFFTTGVWDTDLVGTTDFTKFSDAGSDPIGFFTQQRTRFHRLNGRKPNCLVMGANFSDTMYNHPDILDRIKFTQKGIVEDGLLSELFKIPKVYTAMSTVGDGPRIPDANAQDAATDYSFISDPNSALLCYVEDKPSIQKPSAGYTFTWTGYFGAPKGIRVKRFRHELINSDRIEGEMTYAMKVVCPDMGIFLSAAVDDPEA